MSTLPLLQLGERGLDGQVVDVAGVEPGEQRGERTIGRLVTETPAQQRAERFVTAVPSLPDHEVGERASAAAARQPRPPERVAEVPRDPERRSRRIRH